MSIIKSKGFGVYVEDVVKQDSGFKASAVLNFKNINPTDGNSITLNGVKLIFRNKPQIKQEVQIGDNIGETLKNLLNNPSLPTNAIYELVDNNKLKITYKEIGTKGNSWTIDCDFISLPKTLAGGSDTPDPDWVKANAEVNYKLLQLPVIPGSSNTVLWTTKVDNQHVLFVDKNANVKDYVLGENVGNTGTTNELDIFGDGSCVATYTLDGNANDLGSKYNGKWSGTEAYDNGKYDKAAKFDGNSKVIANPNLKYDTITLSMWLYNTQAKPGDIRGLFTTGDYEENQTFRVVFYNGRTDFQYGANGTIVYSEDAANWLNKWIHITVVINEDYIKIYKNNTLIFNKSGYGKKLNHKNKLQIGYGQWTFKGYVDQVRVFNRELNSEEVNTLYTEQKYKYSIVDADLKDTPSKIFIASKPQVEIQMEEDGSKILPTILEKPTFIDYTNITNKELVSEIIDESQSLVVEGNELTVNDIREKYDTTNDLDVFGDGSCVAAYTLDGAANDLSGKYNGKWSGNEAYDNGKFGKAAKFDGSNDHDIQFKAPFANNDVFTISAWFKWNGTQAHNTVMEAGVLQIPGDINSAGKFRIDYPNNGGNYGIKNVNDKKWHHVCVIHNINNKDICYIDGVKDSERNTASIGSAANWYLGQYRNGDSGHEFDGLIDQVRIFNKTLSEDEINTLYKEQKAKYDISKLNLSSIPRSVYIKDSLELVKDSSTLDSFSFLTTKNYSINKSDKVITDKGIVEVLDTPRMDNLSTLNKLDAFGDNSCIAAYALDGNANDLGNKYNGKWSGTANYENGRYGKAAKFDGKSYITLGNFIGINAIKSISLWFQWTKNFDVLLECDKDFCYTQIAKNGDNLYLRYPNDKRDNYIDHRVANLGLKPNTWYHLVMTNNGTAKVYINGQLKDKFKTNPYGDMTKVALGYTSKSSEILKGAIDQVRLFNRVLTDSEAKALYTEQKYKYTLPLPKQSTAYQWCKLPNRTNTLQILDTKFDDDTFSTEFSYLNKKGRVMQRRIILPKEGIEILPPFSSDMFKAK